MGGNFRFAEPDKTCLASRDSFGTIELSPAEVVWAAGVDIADAFYSTGLPPELRHLLSPPGFAQHASDCVSWAGVQFGAAHGRVAV